MRNCWKCCYDSWKGKFAWCIWELIANVQNKESTSTFDQEEVYKETSKKTHIEETTYS